MKHLKLAVLSVLAVLCLSGCSAAAYFLSGCGSPDADIVVVNNSDRAVWAITLDCGNETQGVRNAGEHALLERGQSYGLELERETAVTVTLSDRLGRTLARQTVDFAGERLYLSLERDGSLSVSEEWSNG